MIALALQSLLAAHAIGSSADVELVRPWFSAESLPGIDSPVVDAGGTVRAGLAVQYERDPLILYERNEEEGVVISHRQGLVLGAAWDLGPTVSVRATLPAAIQWGTEIVDLAREGPLLGDLGAGLRVQAFDRRAVDLGLHADVLLPTGTRYAWMGEAQPRGSLGLMGIGRIRHFDVLAQLSMTVRVPIETEQDFTLGTELVPGLGVRYHVLPDKIALATSVLARGGIDYLGQGGAENSSELLTTLQLFPRHDLQWDIGLGKGLARGYGSSEFRGYVAVTWLKRREPPEPVPDLLITQLPEDVPVADVEIIDEPDVLWEEDELARVEGERIVIRDPIQFEFATDNILPESLPTLRYVAQLLGEHWQIAHVVVEGHASEEGSYLYNYDLSERRARAVWEELIRAGAHPDRMSYRGMGETVPRSEGESEASLARNRRVEFKIVRQYEPGERPEPWRGGVKLPWSGDQADVIIPTAPASPPPPTRPPTDQEPKLDIDQFLDDGEDEAEIPDGATPLPGDGPEIDDAPQDDADPEEDTQ